RRHARRARPQRRGGILGARDWLCRRGRRRCLLACAESAATHSLDLDKVKGKRQKVKGKSACRPSEPRTANRERRTANREPRTATRLRLCPLSDIVRHLREVDHQPLEF